MGLPRYFKNTLSVRCYDLEVNSCEEYTVSNIVRQSFFYGPSHSVAADAPLDSLDDIPARLQKPLEHLKAGSLVNPEKNQATYAEVLNCYKKIMELYKSPAKVQTQTKTQEVEPDAPEPRRMAHSSF